MQDAEVRIGPGRFAWGRRTYVMGILNVTPDSFAGDGIDHDVTAAVARAERMVAEGADIIDVGGESTRPGAVPVDLDTEMGRVLPVVERLAGSLPVPLSVDTAKPAVAEAALRAGATIINDVHGLRADPDMAEVAAYHGAAVVVMANLRGVRYGDVIAAVLAQLRESLAVAARAGIPPERVIVDPGFGFGPAPAENLAIVRRLDEIRALGHPVLLGPSRKSTIGRVLGLPVEERLEGTAAIAAIAVDRGVDIVRVHDVRALVRTVRMADAVVRGWEDGTLPAASVLPQGAAGQLDEPEALHV
jgi:dihydropteroate synthase